MSRDLIVQRVNADINKVLAMSDIGRLSQADAQL